MGKISKQIITFENDFLQGNYVTCYGLIFNISVAYRDWDKDWTATSGQDQLRSGLTGPPNSVVGLNYHLFCVTYKNSWIKNHSLFKFSSCGLLQEQNIFSYVASIFTSRK